MRRGTLPKGVSREGRRKGSSAHNVSMELVALRSVPRTYASPVEDLAAEKGYKRKRKRREGRK